LLNKANDFYSVVCGGRFNQSLGVMDVVVGGSGNHENSSDTGGLSVIVGGQGNTDNTAFSVILGGTSITNSTNNSLIPLPTAN